MNLLLIERASLALLPLVVAAPAAVEGLTFSPAADTTLVKTFTLTLDTALDDSETLMNGDDSMSPQIESSTKLVRRVVVTDLIRSVADGRPGALKRSFDSLSMEVESPMKMKMAAAGIDVSANMRFSGSSPMDSRSVDFTFDKDAEVYKRAWSDGEGEAAPLADLVEDMDMRALLPDGAVKVGDSWDVDPAGFVDILFAGGDLAFELESTGDEAPMGMGDAADQPMPRDQWLELGECSVTAKLGEPRSEGDRTLLVVEFEVELESMADNSEMVRSALGDQLPPGTDFDLDLAETEGMLEGKGTLLWDAAGGHASSLEFSGEMSTEQSQKASIAMGGQTMTIESLTSSSGEVTLEVGFQRK